MKTGTLYIVATPIGNLSDISQRALETLQSVDIIACEDTRVTQKLLNHFSISTKTISYHKFSEKERSAKLVEMLLNGQNIALVSDAGTPLISDPGSILISECEKNSIQIIPIPGCCALITALSAISNDSQFAFLGFFPQKETEIENLKKYIHDFDLIFYESPNRIIKSLKSIKKILGNVNVSIGRELTKIHEEIKTFQIDEMINYLENSTVKGEFVLVIHKLKQETNLKEINFLNEAQKILKLGYSTKDTAKIISCIFDLPKNQVYQTLNDFSQND